MLTKKELLKGSRARLTIAVTASDYRHALEHELETVARTARIPGFRPGHAPKSKVMASTDLARLESGALEHTVNDTYVAAVKEAGLSPVEGPSIEVSAFKAPAADAKDSDEIATFTAEVDVMPEVSVEGYWKIKLKKPAEPAIKEDEVARVVDYLRKQKADLRPATPEDTLQNGMWADLAYEGSVDGVKRTDMHNAAHPMVIGEGQLIPGFEDQLVGMNQGETKEISVTFPKDYHSSELAGKEAKFTVTVTELKHLDLPALDAEFAKGFGHDSYQALEEAILQNIHEEKQQENQKTLEEELMGELVKKFTFEVPASLVEQELGRLYRDARNRLEGMRFNWDEYLKQVNKTEEQTKEDMRPQAEKNVQTGLILGKIVQEEGIGDKEEAGQIAIDRLLEYAGAK